MFLEHLSLTDFRSYPSVELDLAQGVTVLVGSNGMGKTNLVEAIGYLSTLGSHRVSLDGPLLRFGAEQALIRARLRKGSRELTLEVEINAGRANRARINRANPVRARNILGLFRTVLFAPEDLALVKGDPSGRRRFLDDLLNALHPPHAALTADYERVLKQRNALLKSAKSAHFSRAGVSESHESTLAVWDHHMAQTGAQLLSSRIALVQRIQPHLGHAYAQLTDGSKVLSARYVSSLMDSDDPSTATSGTDDDGVAGVSSVTGNAGDSAPVDISQCSVEELAELYLAAFQVARRREIERGISLVGPHRDELELILGSAPAKGYASHGETWSTALSLRLASYYLMMEEDPEPDAAPVLILDDVFAELDVARRSKLAHIVAGAQQVVVTAAVGADIPAELEGKRVTVYPGGVENDGHQL